MGRWDVVRRKAREYHMQLCGSGEWTAEALLEAAESRTTIPREGVRTDDPLLSGAEAVLDREENIIFYNRDADPKITRYYQAHEYAHYWQHSEGTTCICAATDMNMGEVGENLPMGIHSVGGYSPKERREREANIFAREFLLPTDKLRHYFLNEGLNAAAIAERIGLPESLVFHQLAYALLAIEADEPSVEIEDDHNLDPQQMKAARVPHGPFLLEAGPGTGKTRTLVGRILYLLEQGTPPESILALTFSNRAAEEMRARIAKRAPDAAARIWMGTFHAFGLELLRKYGQVIGLSGQPGVVDTVDAIFLLERELATLPLLHYQNLYEPTTYLGDILGAISRAKDELVGPGRYLELANQMRQNAKTSDEIETAEKALEVAQVYGIYQQHLEHRQLLDYGDLIFQATILLQNYEEIRQHIRQTYKQVLVDEYQDVNRASGILLKEIAGSGEGLWVVGDVRQAIYRFRGAAPKNMTLFLTDFPGAQIQPLQYNYRSQPPILDLFAALAPRMRTAQLSAFTPWEATRPHTDGHVRMEIAEDSEAEGAGIARTIEQFRASGINYRDQAVLCRTHSQLGQVAFHLEQAGIPVLSLGNFLEREEIRDLLALISLGCEGSGIGLVRVARYLEYGIPLADVQALLAHAQEQGLYFPKALKVIDDVAGLSTQGKASLALLNGQLSDIWYGNNAWSFLVHYLFNRSNYLRSLLQDNSVAGQQKRLAILQLLQLAYHYRDNEDDQEQDKKRAFLKYVRRLASSGGDRQLRQLSEAIAEVNAVKLLTVHAAKGLEFNIVYLPFLGKGYFPLKRQGNSCPPPTGMLELDPIAEHEEEEECLFFVALSRARNVICLSRALRYSKSQTSQAANLLSFIAPYLPHPPNGGVTWPKATPGPNDARDDVAGASPMEPIVQDVNALDTYIHCPREYYYEVELGLAAQRLNSAYVQFHRCVYRTLDWLQDSIAQGIQLDEVALLARLEELWQVLGPRDHAYEAIYRRSAEDMTLRALRRMRGGQGRMVQPEWVIPLKHGRVRMIPDQVELSADMTAVLAIRRLRTGRATKRELDKDIYALYQVAAQQAYPTADYSLKVMYLSTGESVDIRLSDKGLQTRLDRYDNALAGIGQRMFEAQPDDRRCPRCAYFFICPTAQDDAIAI